MTDQLEARLRGHIGATIELLAGRLNPDWQQSDTLTLAVMHCADSASGPVARELTRLRERERRLEGALRKIIEDTPSTPDDWGYEVDLWEVGQIARAAIAKATAAPAAEQEGE